jgi:hypothetical protein
MRNLGFIKIVKDNEKEMQKFVNVVPLDQK